MRSPSEYVASAFARLQNGPLRDCSAVMRWGDRSATVTCVGSPKRTEEQIDGFIPDNRRVLAPRADFDGLDRGCVIELSERGDPSLHVVTSVTENITFATYAVVALSAPMVRVAISGVRPSGSFSGTFAVCVLTTGEADPISDAITNTDVESMTVHLPAVGDMAWNHPFNPQPGDKVTFPCGKVYAVTESVPKMKGFRIALKEAT